MKNIFFIILLYATFSCHGGNDWDPLAAKAAVKDAIEGGEKLIKLTSPVLEKTSEIVGQGAAKALADGMEISTALAAHALEGASRGVGVEVAKVFAPYVGVGIILFAGVYSITQLYPIGKEVYEANYPTENQKNTQEANTIRSRNTLKFLKTEEELRECLMNSKPGSEINAWRRPTACEDAAQMLKMLGAEDRVDRMTEVFYTYRK